MIELVEWKSGKFETLAMSETVLQEICSMLDAYSGRDKVRKCYHLIEKKVTKFFESESVLWAMQNPSEKIFIHVDDDFQRILAIKLTFTWRLV